MGTTEALSLSLQLGAQGCRRDLNERERVLGRALEQIFATGIHDFGIVAERLNEQNVPTPSGRKVPWTAEVLLAELSQINASLDQAYESAPAISSYA